MNKSLSFQVKHEIVWMSPNLNVGVHEAGLYLWKPRARALSAASWPLRPIWQWNTSSGASRGGLATPYLAWNAAASSAKAVSTVSTTETRRRRRIYREEEEEEEGGT